MATVSPVGVVLEQTPYWARSAFSRTLWAPTIVWNLFNFYTMPAGTHDWWNAIDGTGAPPAMLHHTALTAQFSSARCLSTRPCASCTRSACVAS